MHPSTRPVDAGLRHTRLPLTALVSILHRVTGILLIGLTAGILILLRYALQDATSFRVVDTFLHSLTGHVLGALAVAVIALHLFAGVRHLLLDIDIGFGRTVAQRSAIGVLAATLVTTIAGVFLWP